MPLPRFGDVIFASRLGYNHYGIYINDQRVIHYCKVDSKGNILDYIKHTINCDGIIADTTIDTFLNGGKLYICKFNESTIKKIMDAGLLSVSSSFLGGSLAIGLKALKILANNSEENRSAKKIFSPKETVARAESKLHTGNYNLVFHNCEHFAIWCKTGVSSSMQVKKIIDLVSPIPISPFME